MQVSKNTWSKLNEVTNQISNHIDDLIILGKTLSTDENILELENEASAWIESNFEGIYWRGADIQVVKCSPGSTYEDFMDGVVQMRLSPDEPCPSRHPKLLTGLINKIQKNRVSIKQGITSPVLDSPVIFLTVLSLYWVVQLELKTYLPTRKNLDL